MINIARKTILAPARILAICGFLVLIFGLFFVTHVQAATPRDGERLIVVHADGNDRGIITRATTLRQAFKEANIRVDPHDMVEPGLDEELVATNYDVNIYRARPVVIADGAIRHKIMTPYQTPEQIAKDAEIALQKEDITAINVTTDMVSEGAGLQLTIDRATPFTFLFYGTKTTAYTQGKTVGEMLEQKDITLGKNDTLSVPLDTPIKEGVTVELWRNGKQTAVVDEEIAFEVEKIQDADREVGYRQVKTPGVAGQKKVTYEIEMKNGKEVSRVAIQSVVVREPVKQVEVVGAKPPTPTNPSEAAQLGHQMMLAYGFSEDQWSCLYNLWMKESGWRTTASNPSGAYGIPQALPGNKMGPGWQTDARVQIQWGLGYIKGRYVTPCGAWSAFLAKGWY